MASLDQLSKPRENERRIGESSLQKILDSDEFFTTPKTLEGTNIFYFHIFGDYLKGFLISRQTLVLTNYKTVTYKMKVQEMRHDGKDVPVKNDQVEEFPGLSELRRIIDKNELIGSLVRIVYIGRKKTGFGHSAKVFDVFKDIGVLSRKEIRQDGPRKYAKRKKPGTKPKSGRARARLARSNAAGGLAKV